MEMSDLYLSVNSRFGLVEPERAGRVSASAERKLLNHLNIAFNYGNEPRSSLAVAATARWLRSPF